jgi:putative acetyltransferase
LVLLIRKIEPDDNIAVAEIIREVMTEFGAVGPGYSIQDPEVDDMYAAYRAARRVCYVLEQEGEVVGCGGLAPLQGAEDETCELQKMYFLAEARGLGAGRLMGEMLIMDAQRFAYERIYIETLAHMRAARELYQKLGFQQLANGLGRTGHSGCDTFYALNIEPLVIDPKLLS